MKLADFGVSRRLKHGDTHVSVENPVGTTLYMAPEVVRGEPFKPERPATRERPSSRADDGKKEVQSPWPLFMKQEIWASRVMIRKAMKTEMVEVYKRRWEEEGNGMKEFLENLDGRGLTRLFQLPRSEVAEIVKEKYGVDGAFLVVFCAVVEQVANFQITGYEGDGRGDSELR